MSTRIDIRRTAGGLRLLVPACGAPRRSFRLSYAQAADLITAIRAGRLHTIAGTAATKPSPSGPRGTDELTQASGHTWADTLFDACGWLHLQDQDVRALGDALSAHMPDQMILLPAPRSGQHTKPVALSPS